MTLVLHGPSYNPALPLIAPEALAASINTELTTYWMPLVGGTVTGTTIFSGVVRMTGLATSVVGLPPGTVWNNGGVLMVA